MHGLLEVIGLMLALSGFGVDANPKAPTADAVLAYAVDDADLMVHVDVVAVAPRNYKVLVELPNDPVIKSSPELLAMTKKIKANVEGVRGMAKGVTGLDPVSDVTSVTLFVDSVDGGEPATLAVARGKFPTDFVKKLASVSGGKAGTVDGRDTLEIDAQTFMGTTKDGALVVGPRPLVTPRIDDDWKPAKRAKGTAWAAIATRLDARPFFLFAAKVDDKTARALAKEADEPFVADLLTGHEVAILALHHDGVAFHWKDRSTAGLDRVAMLSEGLVEVTRAAHVAPRGVAKIVIAALDSYKGKSKDVDALIAKKKDLLRLVDEYTGDGRFKVKVDKNTRARTLTVRATGESLSDVVPAALFIPLGAVAFLSASGEVQAAPTTATTPPPRKTVAPRTGGGVKGGVKPKPAPAPKPKR